MTASKSWSCPVSKSSGMSAIATRVPTRQVREPVADAAVDLGVDDRFELGARACGRAKTMRPSAARSSVPSGAQHAGAEALDDRRAAPGVPGATASRASTSASIVGTPSAAKRRQAVGLAGRDAAGQRDRSM